MDLKSTLKTIWSGLEDIETDGVDIEGGDSMRGEDGVVGTVSGSSNGLILSLDVALDLSVLIESIIWVSCSNCEVF